MSTILNKDGSSLFPVPIELITGIFKLFAFSIIESFPDIVSIQSTTKSTLVKSIESIVSGSGTGGSVSVKNKGAFVIDESSKITCKELVQKLLRYL